MCLSSTPLLLWPRPGALHVSVKPAVLPSGGSSGLLSAAPSPSAQLRASASSTDGQKRSRTPTPPLTHTHEHTHVNTQTSTHTRQHIHTHTLLPLLPPVTTQQPSSPCSGPRPLRGSLRGPSSLPHVDTNTTCFHNLPLTTKTTLAPLFTRFPLPPQPICPPVQGQGTHLR